MEIFMTGKERFNAIIEGRSDKCGFWHGDPNPASVEKLYTYFKVKNDFELGIKLGAHCRWVMPENCNVWTNTETPMFDTLGGKNRHSLNQDGVFADTENRIMTGEQVVIYPTCQTMKSLWERSNSYDIKKAL